MTLITQTDIDAFVEPNIREFHQKRAASLAGLKLNDVLRRKNPYLYRAKDVRSAEELVRGILDAYLSSQEEGIFGGFLERLAIHINAIAFGGRKSSADGIDLAFERDGTYYIVAIKSGPNWGNSRQIAKMRDDFRKAKVILRSNAKQRAVEAVNGCCYGRETQEDKGDYLKLCGQSFWSFLSGVESFYTDIIEPIGREARAPNEQVKDLYFGLINRMTGEVIERFCDASGLIDWPALVRFNSGR